MPTRRSTTRQCVRCQHIRAVRDHNLSSLRRLAIQASAEVIDPAVVAERDGHRCHLCGDKVDGRIKWPHPKSGSVDHIVPLAHGGEHTYANVALAHLGCNLSKGARAAGEQLRLVG